MRAKVLQFAVLLMVAMGAGPVGAAIWNWSTTANLNASADPSINWAEGMAPSSVNDSARAMMAAVAAWRNDISAVNSTAGSGTVYTLTTSEGVTTTPTNGQMLSFIAHATNGAAPTLRVDGGNTYPIWLDGAPVASGSLILGAPYRVAFSTSNSAWLLEGGPSNPYNVPLGSLMWSTVGTAPNSSFIPPYGQCISTTTYAAYWVAMGSPASGACPGGQFAVIDMRGRAPVALDTLPGSSAANRLTSSVTGCGTAMTSVAATCANGVEGSAISLAQLPTGINSNGSNSISVSASGGNVPFGNGVSSIVGQGVTAGGAAAVVPAISGAGSWTNLGTLTNLAQAIAVSSNNTSGTVRPQVMPVIGLIPYLRVL